MTLQQLDPFICFQCSSCLSFFLVMWLNILTRGGKGSLDLYFPITVRGVRAGIIDKNLRPLKMPLTGLPPKALLIQFAFLYNSGQPAQGWHCLLLSPTWAGPSHRNHQSRKCLTNLPKANWMEAIPEVHLPDWSGLCQVDKQSGQHLLPYERHSSTLWWTYHMCLLLIPSSPIL